MPWSKIEDVPTRVRTHQGVKLTLEQANKWAEIYDAIKGNPDIENPAGTAWNTWENLYKKTDDSWVKKEQETKQDDFTSSKGEWMESVMFIRDLGVDILGVKEAEGPNGKPLIHGIAVSTDISNDHRFPLDVLEKGINSLIGQPLIEGHSDWPYDIKIQDTHGMIVDAWVNKEEKRAEFLAEVEDAKYAYVLKNMPHRSKFSVGFRHNYEEEKVDGDNDRKIHVSTSVSFDHLGITGNPADEKAVLLEVKRKLESEGFKVIMDGAESFTAVLDNDKEGGTNMSNKDEKTPEELAAEKKLADEKLAEEKKVADAKKLEDEKARKLAEEKAKELKPVPKSAPPAPEDKGTDTKTLEQKVNALETEFVAEQKKNQELEQKIASFEKAEKQRKVGDYVDSLIVAKKKLPAQKDALVEQYMTFNEEQMKNEIVLNDVAANLTDVFGEKAVIVPAKKEDEPTEFEETDRKQVT